MNKTKFIELFTDGAYWFDEKFYHPSFRKGWVVVRWSNISFLAAQKYFDNLGTLKSDYSNGTKYFVN